MSGCFHPEGCPDVQACRDAGNVCRWQAEGHDRTTEPEAPLTARMQERAAEFAQRWGIGYDPSRRWDLVEKHLASEFAKVALAEREACAKVAARFKLDLPWEPPRIADQIAAAIRGRANNG